MIRHRIVECYKGASTELTREQVAARLGLGLSAILTQLRRESRLNDMAGLSIEEAKCVLRHFGGLDIFTAEIEKVISDFAATRGQIQEIERKARGESSGET